MIVWLSSSFVWMSKVKLYACRLGMCGEHERMIGIATACRISIVHRSSRFIVKATTLLVVSFTVYGPNDVVACLCVEHSSHDQLVARRNATCVLLSSNNSQHETQFPRMPCMHIPRVDSSMWPCNSPLVTMSGELISICLRKVTMSA